MLEQQLVDYLKKARASGQTDEQSRALLYKNGWSASEIDEALAMIDKPQPTAKPQQPQPVQQPKPQPQVQPQQNRPKPVVVSQPVAVQIQQPVQSQPQFTQANATSGRVRGHFVSRFLATLIVLLLVVAIAYFAVGTYLNLPYSDFFYNFISPNPNTVVNKMITNMQLVKSYKANVSGEVTASILDEESMRLEIDVVSENDAFASVSPKMSSALSFKVFHPEFNSPVASVKLDVVGIGTDAYLMVSEYAVPVGTQPNFATLDVSTLVGKWLKADQYALAELVQKSAPDTAVFGSLQSATSDVNKKITDILASGGLISSIKKLGSESISGQSTYHYLVTITVESMQDLLAEYLNSVATDAGMLTSTANNVMEAVGDINLELWIGKKDYLLYKYKLDKSIDVGAIIPLLSGEVGVKLNGVNSDFNKPTTIQAPQNWQKIEDVVPGLESVKVREDLKQIGVITASLTDFTQLCNRNLLNGYLPTYGVQLIQLNNDIVAQGGTKPACFSSASDFCVSTQFPDGSYACVDKFDVGTKKCLSSATICSGFIE